MFTRLLSGLAIWAFTVGGSFAWSETSGPASQKVSANTVLGAAGTRSGTLRTQPESAVDRQMLALERRARVDMLLYPGQFGRGEWASTAHPLGAIALSLSAGE
jgi:hypothetical protein